MSIYVGTSELKNIVMGPSPTSMQGPCPTGFHVPKYNEFVNLHNIGVNIGAWANDGIGEKELLKIPLAGYRDAGNSAIFSQGGDGIYRCSEADGTGAKRIGYSSGGIVLNYISWRGNGISIRPFKDTPVVPDSGWTTLYAGTGDAGIFHDSGNGLISLSSDGVNWITIADKNLGATTVWNNGDTLNQNNCGNYYQRGNNYGFPRTGSVTTSGTQVDASNYGPGNYYSNSTFITGNVSPYDRSSVQNDNLWGGQYTPVKEVYVGTTKVRPAAPTLLFYYPLKENLSDYSGNNYNLSAVNSNYQFTTNSEGIKCANLNYSSIGTYFQISSNYPTINLSQNSFSFGFYICDFDKSNRGSSSSGIGAGVLSLNSTFKISVQNHASYQGGPDGGYVPSYEISSSGTVTLNGGEYVTGNQFKKCILRIDTTNNISDFRIDGVMVEKRTGLSGWRTQNQFIIGRDTYSNQAGRYIKGKICNIVGSLKVWDDNDMNWFNSLN